MVEKYNYIFYIIKLSVYWKIYLDLWTDESYKRIHSYLCMFNIW